MARFHFGGRIVASPSTANTVRLVTKHVLGAVKTGGTPASTTLPWRLPTAPPPAFKSPPAGKRTPGPDPLSAAAISGGSTDWQPLRHLRGLWNSLVTSVESAEGRLGFDTSTLATTLLLYVGIIMIEFAVNDLLDIFLGDSVFGGFACIFTGLTIIFGIRLSGLKMMNMFTNDP